MPDLTHLLEKNRAWAAAVKEQDPEFFARLAQQQAPQYLWIGCSDSRVPANQITDLAPGEVFVHRNIANMVVHTDLNCLSVMEFAVDVLRVRHIIVCGHYGCSGVRVAMERRRVGLADNWLRHVQDVHVKYATFLHRLPQEKRHGKLCELNVLEQAVNVCQTTVVQDAWARDQPLAVHSWVYDVGDGLLRDLHLTVDRDSVLNERYQQALDGLGI